MVWMGQAMYPWNVDKVHTDTVNSALEAQPYQMQYHLLHVNLTNTSCYEALTTTKRLIV